MTWIAVGPSKAREWYNKGYRSVPEVRECEENLSRLQKAGLELWEDFSQKYVLFLILLHAQSGDRLLTLMMAQDDEKRRGRAS